MSNIIKRIEQRDDFKDLRKKMRTKANDAVFRGMQIANVYVVTCIDRIITMVSPGAMSVIMLINLI